MTGIKTMLQFLIDQLEAKLKIDSISIEARNTLVKNKKELEELIKLEPNPMNLEMINHKMERQRDRLRKLNEKENECLEKQNESKI